MSSLTNHLKRHLVHFLCLTPKKKKIEQLHLSQYKKTIRIQQQGKGYQPQYVAGSDHHYSEHVDIHYSHLELEELPQCTKIQNLKPKKSLASKKKKKTHKIEAEYCLRKWKVSTRPIRSWSRRWPPTTKISASPKFFYINLIETGIQN